MTIRRTGLCLLPLLALLAASCGNGSVDDSDDGGGGGAETPTSEVSSEPAVDCPGEPLRFTAIAALSGGPTGAVDADVATLGSDAAIESINRECSLGRPLEVEVCDDGFNVNGNLACGRQAAEDGSLAILSTVGSFDDGAAASGLPGIFLFGTSAYELTNENAYSSISGIIVGMGGVSAAKAAGADNLLLVLPDSPALQFVATQVEHMGELIDIDVETMFVPIDTTDYAPIAAQIAGREPDAIGMLPTSPVVMMNALAAEGITPANHVMSMASIVLTPDIVSELGDALDGLLVVSPTVPPTDTDNPGIAAFRADVEAMGADPDDPDISFATVVSWSNIRKLEGALLALEPSVLASLDSETLVQAITDHPIDRPEAAPYDFSANQLPEFPDMAGFRIFTREVVILRMDGGEFDVVSDGFVDMLHPPALD